MATVTFPTYDAPEPAPGATPDPPEPPTYANNLGARNGRAGALNQAQAQQAAQASSAMDARWNALNSHVASTQARIDRAQSAVDAHNAIVDALKASTGSLDADLSANLASYRAILEGLFKTSVEEDGRCTTEPCDAPDSADGPPPGAVTGGRPAYWFDAYFTRTVDGRYARRKGGYGVVTPVPTNYWPGQGPTPNARVNSAGPAAVYTPTIHGGVRALVDDTNASENNIVRIKRAIATIETDLAVAASTLADIERLKVEALRDVVARPDANFRFAAPTPDWLSHDGRLVARLY